MLNQIARNWKVQVQSTESGRVLHEQSQASAVFCPGATIVDHDHTTNDDATNQRDRSAATADYRDWRVPVPHRPSWTDRHHLNQGQIFFSRLFNN